MKSKLNKIIIASGVIMIILISAFSPANKHAETDPIPLKVLWKFSLEEHNSTQPEPIFDKNAIYIYNNQGKLFAIDPKKGGKKWEFKANGKIFSPPSVYNDCIYFCSYDGSLYSLYSANARVKWTVKTFTELASTPYVIGGNEVYVIKNNSVIGYDLEAGLDMWKKDCYVMKYDAIFQYPDFLVFTDYNRFVASKFKKCEVVWDYAPGNMRVDYYQLTSDYLVLSTAKILFAVNMSDGKELWRQSIPPKEIDVKGPQICVFGDELFAVNKTQVTIYDIKTGGVKRTLKYKDEIKRIFVSDTKMLLFNEQDDITMVSRSDYKKGEPYTLSEKINSKLYYYNKQLFFINEEDCLVAVQIPE